MKKNVFQRIGMTAICCFFLCAGGYVNQNAIVNLAGGGAAGVSADGGDAVDAAFLVIPVRGAGGPGNPILGDGGNPQYGLANGNSGYVYGGGGSSAKAS